MLRLIYFLAEKEAERACQSECYGDRPLDVIKLFANRGQAQISCAVAVATADSRPPPGTGRFWSDGYLARQIDHGFDIPLFPAGPDGSLPSSFGR